MLKIYGVYRSRAARNIWLADELGVPFEMVPVLQAYRLANASAADAPFNTQSADFLKVNPNGKIPSIVDGDLVLHESLAINFYLAKKHGGPLAPADLAEEAKMLEWSFWAVASVEAAALEILRHRVSLPADQRNATTAATAIAALGQPFAVLDEALSHNGYLVGGRFTVADLNVAEVVRYAMPAPELFTAAPRVKTWLGNCQSRPAFKAMWERRAAEPE